VVLVKYLNHAILCGILALFLGTALSVSAFSTASMILYGDPGFIPAVSGMIIALVTFLGILTAEWWAPAVQQMVEDLIEWDRRNNP
jgi:hypothetical protein